MNDKISTLSKKIEYFKEKREQYIDNEVIDAEKAFNLSRLFCEIIDSSDISIPFLTKERVEELYNKFITKNGKIADLNKIYENHWIRYCLNEAVIPQAIVSLIYRIEREDKLKENKELAFLSYLYNVKYGKDDEKVNAITIDKNKLEGIINIHSKSVNNNFSPDNFINDSFELKENHYFLKRNLKFKPLLNQASGFLWNNIINNTAYKNDLDRFTDWWTKVKVFDEYWGAPDYMTHIALDRFLDVALTLIEKEDDIIDWNVEKQRLRWESRHVKNLESDIEIIFSIPEKDSSLKDKYLLLFRFDETFAKYSVLDTRENIRFLISTVIKHDKQRSGNYHRISKLIELSEQRPFLLYELCFSIKHNSPELVSWLITKENTLSLGLVLIKGINLSQELIKDKEDNVKKETEIYKDCIDIAIEVLKINSFAKKAGIVSEILLDLTKDYYFKLFSENTYTQLRKQETLVRLEYMFSKLSLKEKFHTSLIEETAEELISVLIEKTQSYKEEKNGRLPLSELRILFWILKLTLNNKFSSSANEFLKKKSANAIFQIYKAEIFREKYKKGEESGFVEWFWDQEGVNSFSWSEFFISMEDREQKDFLSYFSKIEVEIKETFEDGSRNYSWYDNKTRTIAQKIRLHLNILLQIQKELHPNKKSHKGILSKIENTLSELISWYCYDDFTNNHINVFDNHYEVSILKDAVYNLAEAIGNFVNFTSNKKFIPVIINKNKDLGFISRLIPRILSISDKRLFFEQLSESGFSEFLTHIVTASELELLLAEMHEEKDLVDYMIQIINYGDKVVNTGYLKSWKKYTYPYWLLICAQKENEQLLDEKYKEYEEYVSKHDLYGQRDYEQTYKFYKALCLFNKNPKESYHLYNQIIEKGDNTVITSALNRFAAKIKWAISEKDKNVFQKLLTESLEEWEQYERQLEPEQLAYIKKNSDLNKLLIYQQLKKNIEFEALWASLDEIVRFEESYIELRVNQYIATNDTDKLEEYLFEVEAFHKGDGETPTFVKELKEKAVKSISLEIQPNKLNVYKEISIEQLSEALSTIKERGVDEIAKIITHRNVDIDYLILKTLIRILEKILKQFLVFRELKDENKYSQIIIMLLEEYLSSFGFIVRAQDPGGIANRNPGERDIVIEHDGTEVTIIEALRSYNDLYDHLNRFNNYDKIGIGFYIILTYYEDDNSYEYWENYKNNVLRYTFPNLPFKEVYISEDISLELCRENKGNIKLARTEHLYNNQLCNVYHIVMNIGK